MKVSQALKKLDANVTAATVFENGYEWETNYTLDRTATGWDVRTQHTENKPVYNAHVMQLTVRRIEPHGNRVWVFAYQRY